MHFLTRPFLILGTALSLLTSTPLLAATITITVSDNSYRPSIVTATLGDQIVFNYSTGNSSHPTESDNGAWTTFPLNSSNRSHTVSLTTAGTYPYHCQFHGGAGGIGMSGTIVILPGMGLHDDAPAGLALTAFPNPASASRDGVVTVAFPQKASVDGRIRLLNVIGRVVREMPLRRDSNDEARLQLDVADLPAGVYFYSLVVGDRAVETRRLVVQP